MGAPLGLREVTGNGSKESLTMAQWSPLVDILETAHEYLMKVELPAMTAEFHASREHRWHQGYGNAGRDGAQLHAFHKGQFHRTCVK
jgi:hypothetical protein